jgi:hypothetical protein
VWAFVTDVELEIPDTELFVTIEDLTLVAAGFLSDDVTGLRIRLSSIVCDEFQR